MLPALCLSARRSFQRSELTLVVEATPLHCRVVLQDLRDDGLAQGLFARARRMDTRDAQGAGPLDQQPNLNLASGGNRSFQGAAGLRRKDARRVRQAQRLAD